MESAVAEEKLFDFLSALGISTETYQHTPVFTVEEAQAARSTVPGGMAGGHAKSLFIRDKKKRRALVMVHEDRRVDLTSLAQLIGLNRVSFGSKNSLMDMLGVIPGSVTPFSLVNAQVKDGAAPQMIVALDKKLMAEDPLWFHPLHNAATTAIAGRDLINFIKACGYAPLVIDLDSPGQ